MKTLRIAICATALFVFVSAPVSEAQSLLGRLAERAKNAAENAVGKKIENAVNNAVDKVTGGKSAQPQQSAQPRQSAPARDRGSYEASYSEPATGTESNGEYDEIKEFVDRLSDINYRREEDRINNLPAEDATMNLKVNSLADAIKLLPEPPSADQIINLDPSFYLSRKKFSAAVSDIANAYILTTANTLQDPRYKQGTASASQRAEMNAGAMQLFVAMQKYGIDPEKATDEEMEAFMKKAVANGDIQMPSGKGQAFDMNYTDLMESDIDKISDRISALDDAATGLVYENAFFYTSQSPLQVTLDSLYNDSVAKWKTSAAYKKVYDIEKDIDKRAWDYIEKHVDYNNNGAVIPYPPFWVQGRKQENAIIREYNMAYLNQWSARIQNSLEKPIALLKEAEAADVELEKIFPEKNDLVYANLKTRLGTSITHIVNTIDMLMGLEYSAPVINSVEESKVISM